MSASAAVERALRAVDEREAVVRAWAFLDPDRARAEAAAVDARALGPLTGRTLAVKDIFDTGDQPTAYGSPIYDGHRPRADAAAVAMLRAAGAVCLGKAVTAELACFHPGPTTNPHRPTHTPGGSSMGSAAAVAAGMADIALGTQTGGSVIRPASFCGVYGLKPTFGTVAVAGMKPVAPSLDTVGWFATNVDDLAAVLTVLTGRPQLAAKGTGPPAIALVRTGQWDAADPDSQDAVLEAARLAESAGARVEEITLPAIVDELADRQPTLMDFEVARSLAWEQDHHAQLLSDDLRTMLERGWRVPVGEVDSVRADAAAARVALDAAFGSFDVLLTPAVVGEAPEGLGSTGDPRFARGWTLLGVPTLSVPGLTGRNGLPVGVQLVGRMTADSAVLQAGAWMGAVLAQRTG